MEERKRFKDFAEEEGPLEGEKKRLDEILGKEILITAFRIGKSKYKDRDYITLQFENGGKRHITFSGSGVLMKQAQKYVLQLPFYTIIKRVNNYYTMT
jgi:hypothetical protein